MESTRRRRLALTLLFASVPVQAAMTAGALALALHAEAGVHAQPAPVQIRPGAPGPSFDGQLGSPVSCPSGDFVAGYPGSSPAGASTYEVAPTGASGNVQWYWDTGAKPGSDATASNLFETYRAADRLAVLGKDGHVAYLVYSCLAPSGH